MVVDFTEIPQANKGGGQQDRFEQFSCDFLEAIGFEMVSRPDRGADGKKDMIISERREGIGGITIFKWLVSCKHFAHSGKSVSDTDEPDITDRVHAHQCDGFMGVYSTIPQSSLSRKLNGFKSKIESNIFDNARIEKEILKSKQRDRLLTSYFPLSHDKFRRQNIQDNTPNAFVAPCLTYLTEEDILRITKTALIILEIEKIKEEFYAVDWNNKETALAKLFRFADHSNEKVATAIFDFLQSIADSTRAGMPERIASQIFSLILTYFPSSYKTEENERIENGKRCVYIAFSMVYDAFIYLDNFKIAEDGLSIFKFIYREGKRKEMPALVQLVLHQYEEVERNLNRPERTDLGNAKELVQIYKDDLDTWDLGYPPLPQHLQKLRN